MKTNHDEPPLSCYVVAWFNFGQNVLEQRKLLWEQVLWCDETKIELFQHNNVQKIW